MCGVVGIAGSEPVNVRIYDALTVLQHRGQDAAGIATTGGERIYLRKQNGLVKDVFRTRDMRELVGDLGIGHVRYPTAGSSSAHEAAAVCERTPWNRPGTQWKFNQWDELRSWLFTQAKRHLNTHSDSELLLNVFAYELAE